MKPPLVIITGPTASGKSELAVRLAKRFRGEIISADSRQVYRHMDIGTGKLPFSDRKGVSHYCLDIADPKRAFSVAAFQDSARLAIGRIREHGALPFLVGGTGFWIDAVAHDTSLPSVPPNARLRKRLHNLNAAELMRMLRRIDARRARTIEQKNPRRIIRAIEIAEALGRVPPLTRREPYRVLWLGIAVPPRTLAKRIARRANAMAKKGLIAETKKLLRKGVAKTRIHELGFEYRAALEVIEKKAPASALPKRLAADTLEYARRQNVWWKKRRELIWIRNEREAAATIQRWLGKERTTVRGTRKVPQAIPKIQKKH